MNHPNALAVEQVFCIGRLIRISPQRYSGLMTSVALLENMTSLLLGFRLLTTVDPAGEV
jgi:hypothetical protein